MSQLAFADLGMCYCYCPAPISSPMSALAFMYLRSQLTSQLIQPALRPHDYQYQNVLGGANKGTERAACSSLAYLVQETHTTTVCAK